jgi:hypothetical protein
MVLFIMGTLTELLSLEGITHLANIHVTPWSQHVRFAESAQGLPYKSIAMFQQNVPTIIIGWPQNT